MTMPFPVTSTTLIIAALGNEGALELVERT